MSHRTIPTLISIHDVMPETLGKVLAIIERLESKKLCPIYLLVVPGCDWSGAQLASLHELTKRGHQLAGHGWLHKVENIRGLKHRLHSRFISRNVAEHMALDTDGIADLIRRSYDWFSGHDFEPPQIYVPPAWAMGSIPRRILHDLPFRYYEYLYGIYDSEERNLCRMPVVGYEADTITRAFLLRPSNVANQVICRLLHRPLRLAIHPHDFEYRLSNSLCRIIRMDIQPLILNMID